MIPEQTTWGDVWPYGYVVDQTGEAWKITHEKSGWIKLVNKAGEERQMPRPPDHLPVTALMMVESEAIAAIRRAFPGAEIIEIKENQ